MVNRKRKAKLMTPSFLVPLALAVLFAGCATPPSPSPASAPLTPPPTRVYFYPNAGQSAAQQDRDRYECYLWAVRQTGFDPAQAVGPLRPRVEVTPVPASGEDTLAGAFTGALLGAAVSSPRDAGGGAAIGALLGAMLGAASENARQERVQAVQTRYDARDWQRYSQLERRAAEYRRAMAACLEGRGYTVH